MKPTNIVQLFPVSGNVISGNFLSSEKSMELIYLPEFYNPGKTVGSILNQVTTLSLVKKMSSVPETVKPLFNDYLKQTAACLSNVEMALACYNVTDLQSSSHALTNLFFEMKMPAVYELSVQMEELVREYQLEKVTDLLRGIKKIIGQIVKHGK